VSELKARFKLEAWSLWDRPEKPEVPQVPAMLRRRASAADRMALKAAFDCYASADPVATVFCSRLGEIHRSVELMDLMVKGEGHLPMSFSLSVHNAASGLFSIARADASASASVAAGRDSLPMGIFEACAQMKKGAPKVLLVAYDDAIPQPFKAFNEGPDRPFALALLISPGESFELLRAAGPERAEGPAEGLIPLELGAFLASKEASLLSSGWRWSRLDA